jgi:hypothetical protein
MFTERNYIIVIILLDIILIQSLLVLIRSRNL